MAAVIEGGCSDQGIHCSGLDPFCGAKVLEICSVDIVVPFELNEGERSQAIIQTLEFRGPFHSLQYFLQDDAKEKN